MTKNSSATSPYDFSYKMRKEHNKNILGTIIFCLIVFCLINLILTFIIFPYQIGESSMQPTYDENTVVFISPLDFSWYTETLPFDLQRGDVVLLKSMQKSEKTIFQKIVSFVVEFFTIKKVSLFNGENVTTGLPMLRRVIGLPGDTLYITDYAVFIKPLGEQHFLTEFELSPFSYEITTDFDNTIDSSIGISRNVEKIMLGKDQFYVLSDNRISGIDSRLFGTITNANIKGKVILTVPPLTKK